MKNGDIILYKNKLGTVIKRKDDHVFLPCGYGRYNLELLEKITESDIREATHDEKIEFMKSEFSFGKVINIHCVGEYQIVEYKSKINDKTYYHGYINYRSIHMSYDSFDAALIGCIGHKYEGNDGKADIYFCKMIGLN